MPSSHARRDEHSESSSLPWVGGGMLLHGFSDSSCVPLPDVQSSGLLPCKRTSRYYSSLQAGASTARGVLSHRLRHKLCDAGPMAVPTSFPTRFSNEPQLPASCPILEEHHFETPPERSQPRWFPLEESESDNESPTSPLALGAPQSARCCLPRSCSVSEFNFNCLLQSIVGHEYTVPCPVYVQS